MAEFLQFAGGSLLTGNYDFQIAVAAPQGVDEILFFCQLFQRNLPGKFKKAAHVGGFYTDHLMAGRIDFQRFIKYLRVVQIFRDGNM